MGSSSRSLRSLVSLSALPIPSDDDLADLAKRITSHVAEDYFRCRANDLSDK
jgi:hypothetical protein